MTVTDANQVGLAIPQAPRLSELDEPRQSETIAIRWRLHRFGGFALSVVAQVAPWVASIATFMALLQATSSTSALQSVASWSIAIVGSGIAFVVIERAVRPARILAALWRLPLSFVGKAPGRLAASFAKSDDPLVNTLVRLFTHDRRARANAVRVVRLTTALAVELDVNGDDLERLIWAAAVHDIGKLDVPRRILNKPSKPSKKEFSIIRQHASGGENYVAAFEAWLGEWTHGVDHHHERWDGTGYPYGLAGLDISLAGRIIAVADAVEAMTAARAYKRPMPVSAARSEVARCANTQFDPNVAAAFAAIPARHIRSTIGVMGWLAEFPLVGAVQNLGPSVNQLGTNVASGARMAAGAAAITVGGTVVAAALANPASAAGGAQPPAVQVMPQATTVAATPPKITVHVSHTASMVSSTISSTTPTTHSDLFDADTAAVTTVRPVRQPVAQSTTASIAQSASEPMPAPAPAANQPVDTQIDIGTAVMIERTPVTSPLASDASQVADAVSIERAP